MRLEHLLHFSDLFITKENQEVELEETWEAVSQAVTVALDVLEQMRLTEGQALAADLAANLAAIRREVERIQVQAPLLPQLWREKVSARLAELVGETGVDETRLAQEVAFLAERRDLSEELARLESHLAQFDDTLTAQGPVGRKQEFLLQEMLREANTIGSKAGDLLITQAVLEIKGYLERLRSRCKISSNRQGGRVMEGRLINIGFGNTVVSHRVVAVVMPGSAPMKRLREKATRADRLIDATHGRKTRSIIVTDSNHVILSAVHADTLSLRLNGNHNGAARQDPKRPTKCPGKSSSSPPPPGRARPPC